MKLKNLLFFVLTGIISSTFTAGAQVKVQDSLALVDLYNNTTGTGWANQNNWLTSAPASTWYGVTQQGTRVTAINLVNNKLNGSIPSSLGNLDSLSVVNLGQNQLNGGIPASLGNLASLQILNLYQNQLSGAIPSSLGTLAYLQSLNFSQNQLSGAIPSSFSSLVNLQGFILSQNQLNASIPSFLGELYNLTDIELDSNQLSGSIPSSLTNLTNLRILRLAGNQLSGAVPPLPASLGILHPSYLALQNNKFTFSGMENLPHADTLHYAPQAAVTLIKNGNLLSVSAGGTPANDTFSLYNNGHLIATQVTDSVFTANGAGQYYIKATDALAPQLTLYSATTTFSVAHQDSLALVALYDSTNGAGWTYNTNWLTSAPVSTWYGVTVLGGTVTALQLVGNNLVGTIPPSIGNLGSNLLTLNLGNNNLQGAIPASLTSLVALTYLNLYINHLSGAIPDSIGKLTQLTFFELSSNALTGRIPSSIGNLHKVTYLDLNGNQLTDSIPSSLGNMVDLNDLELWSNKLSGPIPSSLGNLVNLTTIHLEDNQLSGNIPSSFGNLTMLTTAVLANNQLGGNIPPSLGSLSKLQFLALGNNQLNGSIPSSLGSLVKLGNLDLSQNQLTGGIPVSFGALVNLVSLNLSQNQLSGGIPTSLSSLANLGTLSLYQNQLSGNVPAFLGSLTNLQELYLQQNQLSGGIPSSIFTGLPRLFYLVLSHNQLSGSIPTQNNDYYLAKLDFSYNQLADSIPVNLLSDARANLKYLDLSHNQFSGSVNNGSLANNFEYLDLSHNQLSGTVPTIPLEYVYTVNHVLQYGYTYIAIDDNRFTFNGMEQFGGTEAATDTVLFYSPQAPIPLFQNGARLFVAAGGTPSVDTFRLYKNGTLLQTQIGDSVFTTDGSSGRYYITVTNGFATKLTLYSDTLNANTDSLIMPARPAIEYASYEYTDTAGWTHYYYDNNTPDDLTDDTLLLSLKKNGQDIGAVGDGTFAVKLVATAGAGSNTGINLTSPLITNPTGYWVMNRYWQVTATHEPTGDVGVRFYYNNQDLKDVNGSYPTHNLTNSNVIFYKAVGGNPDPTTNLAGATAIISIMPGTVASDTTWTYHVLSDTTQYGEYSVASFSGGGGGGTGNNGTLPVTLINFNGALNKNDAQLRWQTAQEINAGNYTVERSLTGNVFAAIGVVLAAGNSAIIQSYGFTDYNAALLNTNTLYYRLKITDKNGNFTYSGVIKINVNIGATAFLVYPNPARNTTTVVFTAATADKYVVEVTDLAGKKVRRIEGVSAAGINNVTVDVHEYAQGAYIITISGGSISKQSLTLFKQ